jgi:hypothetical protein
MKKYIFNIAVVLLALASFSACSDDDGKGGSGGGTPMVRYVRPCDVSISDSLLTGGYLGSQIAIIGENLAGVNAIYFNDQKAKLNPNFVTDNAIIVTIPSGIPGIKEDLIKLYANRDSCYYTFETLVPAPTVSSMACEYVSDGDIAYIQGLYFVNDELTPLTVTFSDGLEAEIISQDLNNLAVRVPAGARPGPVTVTSVYGAAESALWFRDNRNIILDFNNGNYPDYDYFFGWHGGKGVASDGGINGNYLILSGGIDKAGGTADGDFCFDRWTYTPDDPDFLDASDLDKYVLKFEAQVLGDWSAAAFQVIFTGVDEVWLNWQSNADWPQYADTHGGNETWKRSTSYPRGLWAPWTATGSFSTEDWITVTIPMKDFVYDIDGAKLKAANGPGHYSGITLFVGAGGTEGIACAPTFHIDNVRVVEAQ